jgi:hypothetical protein
MFWRKLLNPCNSSGGWKGKTGIPHKDHFIGVSPPYEQGCGLSKQLILNATTTVLRGKGLEYSRAFNY